MSGPKVEAIAHLMDRGWSLHEAEAVYFEDECDRLRSENQALRANLAKAEALAEKRADALRCVIDSMEQMGGGNIVGNLALFSLCQVAKHALSDDVA